MGTGHRFREFTNDTELRAKLDRIYRLEDACIAAQGNNPERGLWCHQHSSEFGEWQKPTDVAAVSEEGLAKVLARFAELAPGYTARWLPQLSKGRSRVFKPRRR